MSAVTFSATVRDHAFGEAARQRRTTGDLARLTGISRTRLVVTRLGLRPLLVAEIAAIAGALNLSVVELVSGEKPAPWWRDAANPKCLPWCTEEHADDEFARDGGLICQRWVYDVDDLFTVIVQACQNADEGQAGVIERTPTSVAVRVAADSLTPEQADMLGDILRHAVRYSHHAQHA